MALNETLPLDEKFVEFEQEDGKTTPIPALDAHWVRDIQFVSYQHPPLDHQDRGAYEEWLERIKFIEEDLHWLLTQPHDKFWCQVVFDQSLHKLLDTYLKSAPRSYDTVYGQLTVNARDRHNDVHRKIFMTCVRMATHKESKESFLTPSIFGEILYENFIFDIPKLMDLCALYGQGNRQLLSKMVGNIFNEQPKYENDLRDVIPTVLEVFNLILSKCGRDDLCGAPAKLDDQRTEMINNMTSQEFEDVIFYLVDVSCTLSSFLDIYPPSKIFFQEANLCFRLATFYDLIIPALTAALKTKDFDMPSTKQLLKNRLSLAKKHLLSIFHETLNFCCLQPIIDKSSNDENHQLEEYVENYLQTLTLVMSERRFVADYEGQYGIQNELDILRQSSADIDETRLSFLQNVFDSAFSLFGKRNQPKGSKNAGGRCSPEGSVGNTEDRLQAIGGQDNTLASASASGSTYPVDTVNDGSEGACAPGVSGPELESLIFSVKDLFPHLGEGFIQMCLVEMNFNLETLINSLLESNLPESLLELDQSMSRFQMRELVPSPPPSVLDSRKNVFDYDEFDIFHRNSVDTTKIHKGKKDKVKDVQLNDKSELAELRPTYEAYGSLDCETVYDKHLLEANMYDDEYDDTYDGDDTSGAGRDADSTDDLLRHRPFTVPRVLAGNSQPKATNASKEESGEESEESEEEVERRRENWIEDPAKLREQREQYFRSQHGGNRGWSAKDTTQNTEKKVYDYKGKAKGQGQSHDVLHNRQWKEKHKGAKGNHNRRALADRKRGKGFGLLGPMK